MINQINQDGFFHQKDRVLFEKYIQAEGVRQFKPVHHSLIKQHQIEPIVNMHKNGKKIDLLEFKLLEEWRYKEDQRLRKIRKNDYEKQNDFSLMQKRIKRDVLKQEAKLIRRSLPKGPILDPLPHLKKARERLCYGLNLDGELDEPPNHVITPEPGNMYLFPSDHNKAISFRIGNHSPSPISKKQISKSPSPKLSSKATYQTSNFRANSSLGSPINVKLTLR